MLTVSSLNVQPQLTSNRLEPLGLSIKLGARVNHPVGSVPVVEFVIDVEPVTEYPFEETI
jgi:hypothetical protein